VISVSIGDLGAELPQLESCAATSSAAGEQTQSIDVGDSARDADAIHEQRIAYCREQMELSYRLYEKHGDAVHREAATYWRIEFERAIEQRSPAQVAKMEKERGLV
jgi:hypothetical protein